MDWDYSKAASGDKLAEYRLKLLDALKRLNLTGQGIYQASKDDDASRIASKLSAWRSALEDAEHAVSQLEWRHECRPTEETAL